MSSPFTGMERVYWLYLLTAAIVALLVYLFHRGPEAKSVRGFLSYLVPKRIYTHSSTWVDFKFMLVNQFVKILCLAPVLLIFPIASWGLGFVLTQSFEKPPSFGEKPDYYFLLFYSVLVALVFDLAAYLGHFLQHKIRFLWEFHKVHHSAQVLSPITVYRMHPVDDMVTGALIASFTGSLHGVFSFWFPTGIQVISYAEINIVLFIFYVLGYNLRHSHVWLSYGRIISHIFMSPAQHQIHHSNNPRHFDKNMGFMLSLWDWMFGTLHVPSDEEGESLQFGLGNKEDHEFSSVWKLYTYPLSRVFLLIKSKIWNTNADA